MDSGCNEFDSHITEIAALSVGQRLAQCSRGYIERDVLLRLLADSRRKWCYTFRLLEGSSENI